MEGYVKSEYGNLWETHQCGPHAYGHTWSPGYEIPAGMLHGHAVSTGMGFGAFLAAKEGFITEDEAQRIYKLISDLELSLWHPILDDIDVVWASQVKMTQKRGGNLCAPVPKGSIGAVGYINDVTCARLEMELAECSDFGLPCCSPEQNWKEGLGPRNFDWCLSCSFVTAHGCRNCRERAQACGIRETALACQCRSHQL